MREIVVGQRATQLGIQQIQVWFRFPVVGAQRQAFYANQQATYNPIAAGDYTGADQAEINLFRTGQWIERAGFFDIIDPTSTNAQIKTRLQNLYAAASTNQTNIDNASLANYATSWDGTTWVDKSA